MGDEVWVKPPIYTPDEVSHGSVMGGNLGWFNNTVDTAFGPVVYVVPLDGQEWYEEIVERDRLGRVKGRRWVIAKATLDNMRNAFYAAWNSLVELGCPEKVFSDGLWDSPWGINLGLGECMELATLMAGLYDESGYDHINQIWAEMQQV